MIRIHILANLRHQTRWLRTLCTYIGVLRRHLIHICRRTTNIAYRRRLLRFHRTNRANFASNALGATTLYHSPLVRRYRTKCTSAKTTTHRRHRRLYHIKCGDPLLSIRRVRLARKRQIIDRIEVFGRKRLGNRPNPQLARTMFLHQSMPTNPRLEYLKPRCTRKRPLVALHLFKRRQTPHVVIATMPWPVIVANAQFPRQRIDHHGHTGHPRKPLQRPLIRQPMRHLLQRPLTAAKTDQIRTRIDQYRRHHRVAPIVVMRHAPQTRLDPPYHNRHIGGQTLARPRINRQRSVGPRTCPPSWRIRIVMTTPLLRRVMVHHRVHIPRIYPPKQRRHTQRQIIRVALGLRHYPNAKALGMQKTPDYPRRKRRMVDIRIAPNQDDVAHIPTQTIHLLTRHRQHWCRSQTRRPKFLMCMKQNRLPPSLQLTTDDFRLSSFFSLSLYRPIAQCAIRALCRPIALCAIRAFGYAIAPRGAIRSARRPISLSLNTGSSFLPVCAGCVNYSLPHAIASTIHYAIMIACVGGGRRHLPQRPRRARWAFF